MDTWLPPLWCVPLLASHCVMLVKSGGEERGPAEAVKGLAETGRVLAVRDAGCSAASMSP